MLLFRDVCSVLGILALVIVAIDTYVVGETPSYRELKRIDVVLKTGRLMMTFAAIFTTINIVF